MPFSDPDKTPTLSGPDGHPLPAPAGGIPAASGSEAARTGETGEGLGERAREKQAARIEEILLSDSKRLEASLEPDSSSARIEVQCLLQTVLHVNRAWLLTHSEQILNPEQHAHYTALFERRLRGEPVAYILGEREFYGLNFKVTPATLIPRPDTELLVELALQRIPQRGRCHVLDLGTGSGVVALSIAHERPNADVVGVDASFAALEVAQFNARRLDLSNVRLLLSDWFTALNDGRFDIIVSNPPYIAAGDHHLLRGDVRFEPLGALASGGDGLDDIRRIIEQAKDHLNDNGSLLMEHGYDQAARVRTLLHQAGYTSVFSAPDLAGIERVSGGSYSPM